jgi:2-succinyl-6-hydroxy-2,4-cyclohexadiene-1-carboxylate synthase
MEKRDLIIALHGFLGKPDDWNHMLKNSLLNSTPIFSPFFFEESEWSPRKKLEEWGDFFLAQCEDWRAQGFSLKLYAYSLGGRLALGPLLKKPFLFKEAHFFSVNPGLTTQEEREIRKINDASWAERFGTENWDHLIRNWNSQNVFLEDYEPLRRESDFSRELLALALTQWSLSLQENYWPKLTELKFNINWWVGQKDVKFVEMAKDLNRKNNFIKLSIIPDKGHRVLFAN